MNKTVEMLDALIKEVEAVAANDECIIILGEGVREALHQEDPQVITSMRDETTGLEKPHYKKTYLVLRSNNADYMSVLHSGAHVETHIVPDDMPRDTWDTYKKARGKRVSCLNTRLLCNLLTGHDPDVQEVALQLHLDGLDVKDAILVATRVQGQA